MRRSARAASGLAVPLLAAVLAACSGAATTAGTAPGSTAIPASAVSSPAASTVSAPPASRSPSAAPSTAPSTPGTTATCLSHVSVLYPGSDNPLRTTCVRVGGTVTIALTATGGYRWMTPTSSAPGLATIGTVHTDPDGTLHATVTARTPGIAILTASETFTPDPHGPPSRLWTLTLKIEP